MERLSTFAFREDVSGEQGSGLFGREASTFPGSGTDLTIQQQREVLLRGSKVLPTGGTGGGVVNSRSGGALSPRPAPSEAGSKTSQRFSHTGGSHASEVGDLPFSAALSAFGGGGTSSSSSAPVSPLIESSLLKWAGSSGRLCHMATVMKVVRLATGRHCVIIAGDQSMTVIDENVLRVTTNRDSAMAGDRSLAKGGVQTILGGSGVTVNLLGGMAGFISSLDCKALPSSSKGEVVCAVGTTSARMVPLVIIPAAGMHAASSTNPAVCAPFVISVQPPLSLPASTSNTVSSVDCVKSIVVGLDSVTKLPSFIAAATRFALVLYNCQLPPANATSVPRSASTATLQIAYDGFQLFKGCRVVRMVDLGQSAAATMEAPAADTSATALHRTDVVHNTTVLSPSASVVLAVLLDNSEVHFIAKEIPRGVAPSATNMRSNKFGRTLANNTIAHREAAAAASSGIFSVSPDSAMFGSSSPFVVESSALRSISMSPRAVDGDYSTVNLNNNINNVGVTSSTAMAAESEEDYSAGSGGAPSHYFAPKGAIASLTADIDITAPSSGQQSSLIHGDSALPEFYAVAEFLSLKDLSERHQSIVAKANTTHGGEALAAGSPRTPRTSAQLDKPTLAPLLAFNDMKCFFNQTSNAIDIVAVGQCNSYSAANSTHAGSYYTNAVSGFICTVRSALKCVTSSQTGALVLVPEESSQITSVPSGIVAVVGSQSSTERGLSTVNVISSALSSEFLRRSTAEGLNTIPLSASLITCNNELFISSLSCPAPIVVPDVSNNTSTGSTNGKNNNTSSGGSSGLKKGLKLLHSFGGPIQSVEILGVHDLPTPSNYSGGMSRSTWFCDVLIGLSNTAQLYRLPLA